MKIFRTELKLERSIAVICDTHISFLNGKKSKLYKDFSQMGRPFYKYIRGRDTLRNKHLVRLLTLSVLLAVRCVPAFAAPPLSSA